MSRYEQLIGQIFDGKYRIDELLGVGGMAAVLKAQDLNTGKVVAIKMLKDEMTEDKQAVKRFIGESRAVAMLDHPNVVKAYDVVITDEIKYIAMEYIEGETLRYHMDKAGKIPVEKCIGIMKQLLAALAHAHDRGVIHRDIKPHNILVLKSGKVILTDFGIARLKGPDTNTVDEKAVGTVYYISPEQAGGGEIDHRSDIYSLGVMLYEMLTGQLPFTGESTVEIAMKHISAHPVPPRELLPTIPKGMEQLVMFALEKDPEDRFQSAEQMAKYLSALENDPFAEFAIVPKEQNRIYLEDLEKTKKESLVPAIQEEKQKEEKAEQKEPEHISVKGDSWAFMPMMLGILVALFIVLSVGGYYAVVNIFWDSDLNVFKDRSGENVIVEDYLGKTFTEADRIYLVDSLGYHKVTIVYESSEKVEKGYVISQDPEGGAQRKLKTVELTVTVSTGSNIVESTFPDYRMKDYRQIRQILLDKGYDVIMEPVENSAVQSCLIIETVPGAGSKITEGMTVTVRYSAGPNAEKLMYTFPDFVGMAEQEVADYVKLQGLNLVKVERVYSDDMQEGRVISCSITPGPKPRLTPLSVVISKGPDPDKAVPLPPVEEPTEP